MKKEVLWISLCAPYDSVAHGGGKTHNFYLKKVHQSGQFHINLVTFCELEEYSKAKADLEAYGITYTLIPWTHEANIRNIKRKIQLLDMMYNPFNKMGGATNEYYWDQIKIALKRLKNEPVIIVLQWTEIVLFADRIKRLYPRAKIVAIEEDVKFLAAKRKMALQKSKLKYIIAKKKFSQLYKAECAKLKQTDLVITYSQKDKELLLHGGIKNVMVVAPFFENYSNCKRSEILTGDIIFYGAMSRQDNYDSAIWFIENVFRYIDVPDIRFVIIGSKPVEKLLSYANDRIIITGYVDTVEPYFENSLCLVAPLVSGAGIKIKVLEALSAGIPVITNDIGIEGISAEAGKDYLFCKESEQYRDTIDKIIKNQIDLKAYSESSKKMINQNYNLTKDAEVFIKSFENL